MERSEINSLFDDFNKNYVAKNISEKVELSLEYFDHTYIIAELCFDGYTYKSFSYDELVNYDNSKLPYAPNATLDEVFQKWLNVPLKDRSVYTGWELIESLKEYVSSSYPEEINLDNPLSLMLYILDERTNIARFDVTIIKHDWLRKIHSLRLTGEVGRDFLARQNVVLDFTSCATPIDIDRELRTKMKFFLYYGNGLDALWDILTGMCFYGDDFLIKRKNTHQYTKYGRVIDFTKKVDKICELFKEASKSIYSNITVKIEFVD